MWRGLPLKWPGVTYGGLEPLQERLCVRPTSETLFCDLYSKEIHSHRDLPKVYNQWCSVVRWGKNDQAFPSFQRIFCGRKDIPPMPQQREAEERTIQMPESLCGFLRGSTGYSGYQRKEDRKGKICRRRGYLYH